MIKLDRKGQLTIYLMLFVTLIVILLFLIILLDNNSIEENKKFDTLATNFILESCGDRVLIDGIRFNALRAGNINGNPELLAVVDNLDDLGDFKTSLESYVEKEFLYCIDINGIQNIELNDKIDADVSIYPQKVAVELNFNAKISSNLIVRQFDTIRSEVNIPLGNLLSAVEDLVEEIENDQRIPQSLILDLMINYGVEVHTTTIGNDVAYEVYLPSSDVRYFFLDKGVNQ